MTSSYRLILASVSPRRNQLLRSAGLRFETRPARTDEATFPGRPARTVEYNSRIKAEAVAETDPGAIVIGSDTVVFRREILGKPADLREARRMLAELGGKSHSVFTGVTVIFPRPRETVTGCSESRVRFKPLDDE
nr:Maf family protein [bacterium]